MPLKMLLFFSAAASVQISGSYPVEKFQHLTETAKRSFVQSAQDCRSTWAPERFSTANIKIVPTYWRRLTARLASSQISPPVDIFALLDELDRTEVHILPKPDYPESPRPYEPHGENYYDFWDLAGEGRYAIVEAYLNCRVRYFGARPRRTVSDYRRMIDDWYGLADFEHRYDLRGQYISAKDIPVAHQFAKVGDVLDRILAADDAAAKTLRPAQVP